VKTAVFDEILMRALCSANSCKVCGSIPFYHLYNTGVTEHFMTTSSNVRASMLANTAWADQGMVGFQREGREYGCELPNVRLVRHFLDHMKISQLALTK
jgi:hypothetical protein